MAKTKVLTAPYDPAHGSLLHYPGDGVRFSHYEDPETGERLERDQIWEQIPIAERTSGPWGSVQKQIRPFKVIQTEPEWRPNEPFHAALQIDYMQSGRSAKYVILKPYALSLDVRRYPMFVADLIDIAYRQGIDKGGVMTGRWMVSKRGQNYGLRAAKEGE